MKTSRLALVLSTAALLATVSGGPALARPHVRRVCNGSTVPCPPGGHHKTIAHALRRARPGDWILVWPGVYHEKQTDRQGNLLPDGLLITTPSIHLRGLDRNLVIVDGSNGTAADPCPSDLALQDLTGRNGIEISKVDGVSVENLTVCNYLPGPAGGEIVADGQVLHGHPVDLRDLDAVAAGQVLQREIRGAGVGGGAVAPVDDHEIPVQAPQVDARRRDEQAVREEIALPVRLLLVVDARPDEDPVAGPGAPQGVRNRLVVAAGRAGNRAAVAHPAHVRAGERGAARDGGE